MKLPVTWSQLALTQLNELHAYISGSRPAAAGRQVQLVLQGVDRLTSFPELGRIGRRPGTRELAVGGTRYIVVYRVRDSALRILGVMHGARRWPRSFAE